MKCALALLSLATLAACAPPEAAPAPEPPAAKVEVKPPAPPVIAKDTEFIEQFVEGKEKPGVITMRPNATWRMNARGQTSEGTVVVEGDKATFTILKSSRGVPKAPHNKFTGIYDGTDIIIGPSSDPHVFRRDLNNSAGSGVRQK